MIYEFREVVGTTIIEESFPASKAPELGAKIERNGKVYERIMSGSVQLDADIANVVHKYPYVSHSLPRFLPNCPHTKVGKPIIRSQNHEREIMAQTGRIRD